MELQNLTVFVTGAASLTGPYTVDPIADDHTIHVTDRTDPTSGGQSGVVA